MVGSRPEHPPLRLGVDCGGAGCGELGEGTVDGGFRGGAAVGTQKRGELLGGDGSVVAEHPEDAGGGRAESGGGRVGQLGQGPMVGAAEVVPRQHRSTALPDPGATAVAGTAAGSGEQKGSGDRCRAGAGGGSPRAPGGRGDLADAGVALGPGLKPLPNWLPAW